MPLFSSSNYYYFVGVVSWRQLLGSGLVGPSQLQCAGGEVRMDYSLKRSDRVTSCLHVSPALRLHSYNIRRIVQRCGHASAICAVTESEHSILFADLSGFRNTPFKTDLVTS